MTRLPASARRFLDTVSRTLDHRSMLKGGERVVVAVSGGADSLAMLHALHRLRDLRLDLHVAHFDHRLREGSERDAAFVARTARRLELPATVGEAESSERVPGESPEETARNRRKSFLQQVAESIGASRIATGHTLDDQAETVLMRLLFGTGPRGLGGIPPRRWWYIRPLIDVRRAQTHDFCRSLGLRPRQDPSNEDPAFRRNVLRHETIPFLASTLNQEVSVALARLADLLREEDQYLHGVTLEQAPPERLPDGTLRLSLDVVRALPVALQRRALRYLAASAGSEIGAVNTEALRALVLRGETGQAIDLPGPLNARLEYGFLVVDRDSSPPAPASPVDLVVPGETELIPWGLRARSWLSDERPPGWPDGRRLCVLDADRVTFPLRVRRARPGDRFRPLGMARSKKVGDFFTDAKVARARRGSVPLVVDASNEVVWVIGHRIDDRAKVTGRTGRCLWLEVEGDVSA